MDPYSSFWDKHDFYIYGCHNSFSKSQYQDTNLAGYLAFYRCFGRYLGCLVEGIYFTCLFWLHIPGGGLFGIVFAIVAVRAFWEMYRT